MSDWPRAEDLEPHGEGAATPEQAARGDIPEKYSPVLFVDIDASGDFATVLLGTDGPENIYPYEEVCFQVEGRWYSSGGSNGGTRFAVQDRLSLLTEWGEAPPGSNLLRIEFQGKTYDCPVRMGYYRLVVWDWDEALASEHETRLTRLQLKQAKVIDENGSSRIELDPSRLGEDELEFWNAHGTTSIPRIVEVVR
jgi:hypothetical protein